MIKAHVHDDVAGMNVAITIVNYPGEGVTPKILRHAPDGYSEWEDLSANGAVVEPSFRVGQFEARAMLDALTAHFHGADDARALRRDYDAERGRVDKLTDAVISMATKLAQPPPSPTVTLPSPGSLRGGPALPFTMNFNRSE